jgi:hypothetical protein
VNHLYKNVFPQKYNDLKALASNNGEVIREGGRGVGYTKVFNDFKGHLDAVGMMYGIVGRPVEQLNNPAGGGMQSLTPEQIQQLMDAQQ